MQLYRFSPIKTEEELQDAVAYISGAVGDLSEKLLGERFPLGSLTVFAHYEDEFERLVGFLEKNGERSIENNGPYFKLREPLSGIALVRIRKPDPYRMQVGCADLAVGEYKEFKKKYGNRLHLIEREEYEMLELHHPDLDVLAYVVSVPMI